MGETADQLRQEIESKRQDASEKIDQIEQKVTGAADQVRGQVDQVMQTFDWRKQVDEKPLVALGTAFIGGIVLGSVLGGDDDDRRDTSKRGGYSFNTVQYGQQGSAGAGAAAGAGLGVMAAVRNAAKNTGFEDTLNNMTSSLMSTLTERIKDVAEQTFPGMAGKLENATKQATFDDGSSTPPSPVSSGARDSLSPATGSTPTSAADYARSGELGSSITNG